MKATHPTALPSDIVIHFIEQLILPSGEGAGECFRLRPWQKSFIREIYDPLKPNGSRVVRRAILSMARKNGKTMFIAALVMVHLCGPMAIRNGEIYSAANDREQAAEVFKVLEQFVEADPDLQEILKVTASRKNIYCPSNGTRYRAISRDSKTKHGQNPSLIIFDEMAQSPVAGKDGAPTLYETLRSSQGARGEPLFFIISTQSHNPEHPLSKLIDAGLATNDDGTKRDPETVCRLYAAPDDAEIMDESAWRAANPGLDDFLSFDFVRGEAENARDLASFEPVFRNLHLNQRVSPLAGLIHATDWKACYDPECHLVDGEEIYLGLDYADVGLDLCALVAVSAADGTRVGAWFWKPEAIIAKSSHTDDMRYDVYAKEGLLEVCRGKTIDYRDISAKIIALCSQYKVCGMAYDRYRVDSLLKHFEEIGFEFQQGDGEGLRVIPFRQTSVDMSPAIDAFERSVINTELKHPGHPILSWTVSNALVDKNFAGDRILNKAKSKNRIDGAVALTMAIGLKARERSTVEYESVLFSEKFDYGSLYRF